MKSLLLVIAVCSTAYAQAPGETPVVRPARHKSLLDAYLITWAATAAPVVAAAIVGENGPRTTANVTGAIACAALVLGPSAGHWYAGHYVTTGLVLRATAAVGVAGLVVTDPHAQNLGLLIVGGTMAVGLWEAGTIVDLATLPRAIRRANANVQLVPILTHETQGLALAGSF